MPKITHIRETSDKTRIRVFIDGEFCVQIRARTFSAMNLCVGQEISCNALKELETHFWKHSYGKAAWEKEKIRLDRVRDLLEWADERAEVVISGFGANSTEFIAGHLEQSGTPDIEVKFKGHNITVLLVEVSGTEYRRGSDYWVRPDKLQYAQDHPDQDVWIILHYAKPREKFVIIKPKQDAIYTAREVTIRGAVEYYVVFTDSSDEITSLNAFKGYLNDRFDHIEPNPSKGPQ